MGFVPLHVHSGFSYLESGLLAERLPFLAAKRGYSSIAISDKGSMSGYAPFYHACEKAGIKPLFGVDFLVPEGTYSLYVLSEEGYRNLLPLLLLSSQGKLTLPDIEKHSAGLQLVYSLENAVVKESYLAKDDSLAEKLSSRLRNFPNAYLGLPYTPKDPEFAAYCRTFAKEHSYPLVAFPAIYYEKKADAIVLRIVEAIASHNTLTEKEEEGDEYFLSSEEVGAFYASEEIALTEEIGKSSSFSYIAKRGGLLHYENGEGLSSGDYLRKLSEEGLRKKKPDGGKEYEERLHYELGVIEKMGYSDYFLIVGDYVNYAKTHGISVGPGRGSGAGSLVAYSLGIVEADPIKYSLLFERFLNPERQSMPDIDVDFSDLRRDEVVVYLQRKYGEERVGHVLTTQTIGAKESLRDIGRVYEYEDREIDLVCSAIVDDKSSLRDDYRHSPQFRKLVDSDKYYLQIVSLASKIEGLPRQAGIHPAGVILNDKPLVDALPVTYNEGVGEVGCLEKDYLEEQGFLKMDILSLRNLSIIDQCLALIKENEGISLTEEEIPYEDKEPISLIHDGRTMGLFQLESPGIKRAIAEIRPTEFEDVVATIALFRPGPMASIPSFAKRKNGEERITYPAPELEPVLKNTYGVIVYQEQIMQIVRVMAGYSYAEADLFRRAISKKDASKLEALKGDFIKGCLLHGESKGTALNVYNLIEKFANYGFNKSHALVYAVLTCKMAYLKYHYPKEFYCAILDYMSVGDSKFKSTLSELKERHIALEVPSINGSGMSFSIDGTSLRLPLSAIKGLQSPLLSALIDERSLNGPYLDLYDFAARGKKGGLALPALIRLIDAGALDCFGVNRASLRASGPGAMNYAEMLYGENGDQALLTGLGIEKPALKKFETDLRSDLDAEYEALGLMVSGSPLLFYKDKIAAEGAIPLGEMENQNGTFKTVGIVKDIRAIVTRKGSQMAFLELYDETDEANFVLFSEAYAKCYPVLKDDKIVVVSAHKDYRKENSYLVEDAKGLED